MTAKTFDGSAPIRAGTTMTHCRARWRLRRSALALLAAIAVVAVVAPTAAEASSGAIPASFFGVNWDVSLAARASPENQATQFSRMKSAGVTSVRAPFYWWLAQPRRDGRFNFAETDGVVAMAAENGIRVLPAVLFAPKWARQYPFHGSSPPRNIAAYAHYLNALIARYGPGGTFWSAHPDIPAIPIRSWQIWNEPRWDYQWWEPKGTDWAPRYVQLLRLAYKTVKNADPGAQVILAGLPNDAWNSLKHLYKAGIHGYFDVVAIHPYASNLADTMAILRRSRAVMRSFGDGNKPMWVTELGIPAAKNRSTSKVDVQTTDDGMANFLSGAYRGLASAAQSLRITGVYWYDWASTYPKHSGQIFNYSGLLKWEGGGKSTVKPAYRVFARLAAGSGG
jgi:polysaccharide biosynthesis protein PslG